MVASPRRYTTAPRLSAQTSEQRRAFLMRAGLLIQNTNSAPALPPAELPKNPYEWSYKYRRPRGAPFSLDRYRPLIEIYKDQHRNIAVIKPAQRGLSEWALNYACFSLDVGAQVWQTGYTGLNVAYIFPFQRLLNEFSKERIGGLENESEYLAGLFGSGRYADVTFKQIRDSYFYLRGGASPEGLRSFRADVLFLDEYDDMTESSIALAEKRQNASEIRRRVSLSTPTYPQVGIDELYRRSDKQRYWQQCPNCREWNVYDFFRDVRVDGDRWEKWQHYGAERIFRADVALHCPSCEYDMDTEQRCVLGEWKADDPDVKTLRGYQIPPMAYQNTDLTELAMKAVDPNPTMQTEFFRSDLGRAYHASGSNITEEMLVALAAEYARVPEGRRYNVTMGVDVGKLLHVQIAASIPGITKRVVVFMGTVSSFDELEGLHTTYRPTITVIDGQPETIAARDFAKKHVSSVYLASYPSSNALINRLYVATAQPKATATVGQEFEPLRVQINRTMGLDQTFAVVSTRAEHWPGEIVADSMVRQHMTASSRVIVRDDEGQDRATWVHSREDHYMHSTTYRVVADEMLAEVPRSAGPRKPVAGTMKATW